MNRITRNIHLRTGLKRRRFFESKEGIHTKGDDNVSYTRTKSFSLGAFAGVLGSLVGMGGGFVIIPALTSQWFRISQHAAHGTSLFAVAGAYNIYIFLVYHRVKLLISFILFLFYYDVIATGIAGAIGYGFQNADPSKNVQMDSAVALAVGGMMTARWGANMATKIPSRLLKRGLGCYMICVSPLVYIKASLNEKNTMVKETLTESLVEDTVDRGARNIVYSGLIGLFSGFLAGLLGVGGGSVVVPALCVTSDMSYHSALGTSLFAMTLPAMVGTYTHYRNGHVVTKIAPALASGSLIGAYLGGKFASSSLPEDQLRLGFSTLTLVLGIRTLIKV